MSHHVGNVLIYCAPENHKCT